MKIVDLPEEQKYYLVKLSNGDLFPIDGLTKAKLMDLRTQFVELKTGEIVNKSFIVSIVLDRVKTKDTYLLQSGSKGIIKY